MSHMTGSGTLQNPEQVDFPGLQSFVQRSWRRGHLGEVAGLPPCDRTSGTRLPYVGCLRPSIGGKVGSSRQGQLIARCCVAAIQVYSLQ